jgi:cysteine desulfurase
MPPRAAIYLDANASAPLKPEVQAALKTALLGDLLLPNPSSIHAHGRRARRWLSEAREQVANSLGADPEQLILTSSGTEANQLAVRGVLEPWLARGEPTHWILSAVEHDSTRQLTAWAKSRGGQVTHLPVDRDGRVSAESLAAALRPETRLVSAVWVNNETGVISDVEALRRVCRAHGARLHVDAAQAWGKLPIAVEDTDIGLLTVSGHKIGAPAGIGALWVGRGVPLEPLLPGKQEKGRRGGTENVLGAIALGAAAAAIEPLAWARATAPLRDRLEALVRDRIPGTRVNGGDAPRVANTLNLSFDGVEGDSLVMALDLAGFSVSSGSACSSGVLEPSHVLLAMGLPRAQAMAALRVSLPGPVEWESLAEFAMALEQTVARVRCAGGGRKAAVPT